MLLYVRSDKKRGDNFQSSVSHSHKLVDYCSSQLTADLHIVLLKNDSCIYQQNVYICVFERIFFSCTTECPNMESWLELVGIPCRKELENQILLQLRCTAVKLVSFGLYYSRKRKWYFGEVPLLEDH